MGKGFTPMKASFFNLHDIVYYMGKLYRVMGYTKARCCYGFVAGNSVMETGGGNPITAPFLQRHGSGMATPLFTTLNPAPTVQLPCNPQPSRP